jgi:regulator of protease activity HflC (stomatin/prohibitin superfamily)
MSVESYYYAIPIGLVILFLLLAGIRIVRPTRRMLVETLGKYSCMKSAGFTWIVPIIQRGYYVNITEQMVDAQPQEIITNDNLNARVDAQVYFKVRMDEISVKASQYNVNNYERQIVNLARTTLRNIIGTMKLKEANSERDRINKELLKTLVVETKSWGIDIVRTELKEIDPPKDVQDTMNKVVKAENEKVAAIDFATAKETEADGLRRAEIKKAEGERQAAILKAEGKAKAFELINKSFIGNAQLDKKLEITRDSLVKNSKIILTDKGITPNIILGELPIKQKG